MDTTFTKAQVTPFGLVREMRRRNPLLFGVGVAHLVLLAVMLVIAPFDGRLVTGVNPWIKPMKFAASIAVYVFTVGWLLYELPLKEGARRLVNWLIAAPMTVEIVLITAQAARGVRSHFNYTSHFDMLVFSVMGWAIVVNTVAAAYVTLKFWKTDAGIPAPYLWGIRMGFLIFVLASLEGFAMVSQSAHSVGVPDGGAGLPVVNWSTKGGDLRVAHFFGMHALQALPLIGYLLSTRRGARLTANPVRWVKAAGAAYALAALLLFVWAMSGRALVSL
ncbi:MAG TPA: hypothetical protein VN256_05765 [Pyrinomonadaceae bacterium]|nr:hypothetical protein [Pyrinomonadaceae bacterium]